MSASLTIKNLHAVTESVEVLRGINLKFRRATIGPSGRAVHLLRVLMTLDQPTSGDIEIGWPDDADGRTGSAHGRQYLRRARQASAWCSLFQPVPRHMTALGNAMEAPIIS